MKYRKVAVVAVAVAALTVSTACSSNFNNPKKPSGSSSLDGKTKGVHLSMMIASSGDAETNAVKAATAAWGKQTGNTVTVDPASNITQQLTQAMAGGSPPDLFYGEANMFQGLAKAGNLADIGNQVTDPSDFYAPLVKSFTLNNQFYCPPKDFSTLAIEINTTMWKAAGLTNADLPTTWAKLQSDAKKLTGNGVTGLVISDTLDRLGAFMKEAGGSYTNAAGTQFTFDSPQNLQAMTYLQGMAKQGILKFPKQVGATWGGDAMGMNKAAMTVEGNWFVGGVKADYPKLKYMVVPMPVGPTGKQGTLSFTDCWGVAAKSANTKAAVSLIDYLTTDAQQLKFANLIGVMPSRQSARAAYIKANPASKAFIDEAGYAMPQVTTPGFAQVQQQFDSQIINLGSSANPKTMLQQLQKNASALK